MPASIRLSALTYYPVKSMQGWDVPAAAVTPRGLANDRLLMVADRDGMFYTQRDLPRLAAILPRLEAESLTLSAPEVAPLTLPLRRAGDALPVTIWDDEAQAVDQGDEAAGWLSMFLGVEARLVRMPDDYVRSVSREYAVTADDHVGFADGYPLLLASQESLDDLNARMETPIPMNRFRPNIVVSGCDPFAEDGWKRIRIGEVELALVKPCARCDVPTHDQVTGRKMGKEPTATLATFRRRGNKVMFAMNAIPVTLGMIRLGDQVQVLA
jgi:uncharacterized protein YcbX